MVKKVIAVLFLAAFCILGAMLLRPHRGAIPWFLDDRFSLYLTAMADNYKAQMNQDISSYVSGLRVFKTKQDGWDMLDTDALFRKEVVFESANGESIKEFLRAIQEQATVPPGCNLKYSADAYHVLGIDNSFMRMGYFLVRNGECHGQEYAVIKSLGSSSVYYTKPLVPLMRRLGLSRME